MLGKGYIKLNNETIPNPTGLNISDQNFDSIKTSETGEDVGTTSRLRKQTFQFSFRSSSRGRDKIVHFCELSECTMTFNGVPKYGRLRITAENWFLNRRTVKERTGSGTCRFSLSRNKKVNYVSRISGIYNRE